jgi:hypothetical protein
MNRPTGVTVLAVLDFIGAGMGVLCGVLMFLGGAFLGAYFANIAQRSGGTAAGAGVGAAIGIMFGIVFLVMAAVSGVVGFGMWNLKEWGRILQLIFAGLGALGQAFGVLSSLFRFRVGGLLLHLVFLAINAWIIFYLIQPHVRAAFAAKPPMQAAMGD